MRTFRPVGRRTTTAKPRFSRSDALCVVRLKGGFISPEMSRCEGLTGTEPLRGELVPSRCVNGHPRGVNLPAPRLAWAPSRGSICASAARSPAPPAAELAPRGRSDGTA
eukprot:2678365-Pyramimonas_sp.AAC.2